jgi:hypothetical protein
VEITEWKEKIVEAVRKKFPKKWSTQDRLLGIVSQVADTAERIQFEEGLKQLTHLDKPVPRLIANIFVDLFVLCHIYNVDLNKELQEVLDWLQQSDEVR